VCAAERRRDRSLLLALALILLLALALRLYHLDGQSLWADEGNSAALAGRPFAVIAEQAALDIHPPLYYWLLKIWCSLFGQSEAALRGLSVLFSLGVVVLVYALGAELAGPPAGLAAALLTAVSPLQVYYAQEARMYMLMAFWSALAAWAAWRWIVHPRRPFALIYMLAGAAGLYTHYFFPAVLLACNLVFLFAWLERRRAGTLAAWAGMQAGMLLLYLPWLGTGLSRLLAWPRGTAAMDIVTWLGSAWRTLCLGPAGLDAPWSTALPFALLLALGAAALALAGRERAPLPAARWLLPFLGWLIPVALMAAGGIYQPARLKFLMTASPFFALCLGAGAVFPLQLARAGRRPIILSGFLAGLLVALALIPAGRALHRYYTDPTAARDDYRGMVAYIRATAGPEDAVILNAPGQWDVFSYYYRSDPWPVYRLPAERPPNRASLEQTLAELSERHRRLYVLYWATDESDPERIMEGWLDAHAFKGVESWFGNVRFVIYTTLRGWDAPMQELAAGVHFDSGITLARAEMPAAPVPAGDILPVSLVRRAERIPSVRWKVFLQVLDAGSHIVGQRDAEPLSGAVPTTSWSPGAVYEDHHGVPIEPGTPPGTYQLIAGMYDPSTGARAAVRETGETFVRLGSVEVSRPARPLPAAAVRPMFPARVGVGPLIFLGYDRHALGGERRDVPIPAGTPLHVALYWQAQEQPAEIWRFQLWVDEALWVDWTPLGGGFTTDQWLAGDLIRDQVDGFLPAGLSPGRHHLRALLRADRSGAEARLELGYFQLR
jgi:hypothetical protein